MRGRGWWHETKHNGPHHGREKYFTRKNLRKGKEGKMVQVPHCSPKKRGVFVRRHFGRTERNFSKKFRNTTAAKSLLANQRPTWLCVKENETHRGSAQRKNPQRCKTKKKTPKKTLRPRNAAVGVLASS